MVGLAVDVKPTQGSYGAGPYKGFLNELAGTRTKSTGWLESFGLSRPVPDEDWHIQLAGTTPTGDSKLTPSDKGGQAIDVSTGKQVMSASKIDSLSQENNNLKGDLKKAGSIITNNITENSNGETTRVVSYNKPSDTPPHIEKSQGTQEENNSTNDKSAYANKVS